MVCSAKIAFPSCMQRMPPSPGHCDRALCAEFVSLAFVVLCVCVCAAHLRACPSQVVVVRGPGSLLSHLTGISKAHAKHFLTRKQSAPSTAVSTYRLEFRATELPKHAKPAAPQGRLPSPTGVEPVAFQVRHGFTPMHPPQRPSPRLPPFLLSAIILLPPPRTGFVVKNI